ncbi:MAG: sugar ABC transporter permease [Roseburia sp.]|jgi:multiple sugar transport system permease protein|nr:sugar ABC transporter permease [Roseburia sp.]
MKKVKQSGILYIVPALLIVALVMLYPLVYTLVMGFFKNTLFMKAPEFFGIGQYIKLFGDEVFVGSIVHTLVWTFGSVFFQFTLGFVMAMILHQDFVKGKTVLRILLMIPWVLPSVIGSAVWKWMYNADYGLINFFLNAVGLIDENRTWLSSTQTAMPAIIAVNVWKMFPYVMLMIEAALQGVSRDLKEAALIDGANKFEIFRNVTWTAIAPQCYSVLLLMTVWTLNAFTFVYNLTEGGPAHSTEVMAMFIYKKAFTDYDFGLASAASTVLFSICMIISLVYILMTNKRGDA